MKIFKFILLSITLLFSILLVGCITDNVDETKLDTPIISISEGSVRWSKIDGASEYIIKINEQEIKIYQNKYDLSNLEIGEYKISVKAISKCEKEDSDYSNTLKYEVANSVKEKLDSVSIKIEGKIVSWNASLNANSYKVYVNNNLYATTSDLSYELTLTNEGTYTVYVVASDTTKSYLDSNSSNIETYVKVEEFYKIEEVKRLIDKFTPNDVKVTFIGKVIGFDSLGYAHVADETGVIYVRAFNQNLVLGKTVKISGFGFVYRGSDLYPEYTRQISDKSIKIEVYNEEVETIKDVTDLRAETIKQYNKNNFLDAPFMGNIVSIKGIVEVGKTRYSFYLNDDMGNHIVAIHHYSSNFQNDIIDHNRNVFLDLNGQEVTLTGIMYRFYSAENIWTFQCIGLNNEVVTNEAKLLTPNVELNGDMIAWNQIPNATSYQIYTNGLLFATTSECEFDLTSLESGRYEISVCAIDEFENYTKSSLSHPIEYAINVESNNVNLFMINDTHGSFLDSNTPGIGRVSTLISNLESQNGDYIKIANGDVFQGSYISSILYGLPLIDALNAMNFDAYIIGNHEFDWGLDKIREYKDGNLTNGEANFPFVCANIYDKRTNLPVDWLEPYTIVENNGQKVGIIGLIGYELESSILATNVKDYDFVYPLDIVKNYAEELRIEKDCDSVVVSIHDYDPYLNSEIANLSGNSKVDAILCGHTHSNVYESITRSDSVSIPVVENRDKNQTATSLILEIVDSMLNAWKFERLYPSNYDVDSKINEIINRYQSVIDEGNRILGTTSNYLSRQQLGNYAVLAMNEEFQTDFAIMNTGGVRATIDDGEITVSEVFEVFPFNNCVYLTKLTGRALKSLYESNSDYLYISNNYYLSTIDDNKVYTISVIDYVYTSSYYVEFIGTTYANTNIVMRDLIIDYLDNLYN